MVAVSIGNDGIGCHSAEGLSSPNTSTVSADETGQDHILQDHGGQKGSDFSEEAAEAGERRLPTPVLAAGPAKEQVTADPTSSSKSPTPNCNEAVPSLGPVIDKEGIPHAVPMDRGPKCTNIAATSMKNTENDPRNPSLEPSPPAAITEMQGVAQMGLSDSGWPWLSEQLGGTRGLHVSAFPPGEGGGRGDYFTAQEARQERGVLEVGQPQTGTQQGRQDTDGGEGLLMKKETLIRNYPATGGSDSEKCGAIVNAQGFAEMSEVCNLQMGAVTAAKGKETNPALSGSKREQSGACTLMSELPSNPPNLLLVPTPEEPSREYVPGNDSQDPARSEAVKTASEKSEPVAQREHQKEDELVSAEPFSVPLSAKPGEEQKSAVTTESPKDEASSNEMIKAADVSRESTTFSETESSIRPTKENSPVDNRLFLEEYASKTSLSRSTELNQKETEAGVTGEKPKMRGEEAQATESSELPKGSSGVERQPLNSDSNHQDMENAHLGHNSSTGDLGEETGGKPLNSDSNFKSPEDDSHSPGHKPEQQMSTLKAAVAGDLENKLVASPQVPREECPLGCDCFNTKADGKTWGQPGCVGTEKVCLASAHSSPLLHSENNNIKQSKQDEAWEKAFARETVLESECETESREKPESCSKSEESTKMSKSKLELQGLNDLAGTVDVVAVQTEASQGSETKEQNGAEERPAAAQSSAVDGKENEGVQEETHQAAVRSFVEDKDLALKSERKSDVLMQAQLEQVAAESPKNTQMACSKTSQGFRNLLAPQHVHVEEGGDSHMHENSDTCSSAEALECTSRELQENADVPTAAARAEQMETSVTVAGDWISNTKPEQQQQQSGLTTDGQEHRERALKPEQPLGLNDPSNIPEIPQNISDSLNTDSSVLGTAPIQRDSDAAKGKDKGKSGAVLPEDTCGSEHRQSISGVTVLGLQSCNEQNKTDLKAEENCCSKQKPSKPEQDDNSLISASQHEAARRSEAFCKGSDEKERPGRGCRIKDDTGEICAVAGNALPGTQNAAGATNTSQALPSDTEIAHTPNNSEENDPQVSCAEAQGETPLMAKNEENIESLTPDGGIIQKDGNVEISGEDSTAVTETSGLKSDQSPGPQRSLSPSQAHGDVIPTDNSDKSSCIQQTPEEPGSCQVNAAALSAQTSAPSGVNQRPANTTSTGTGGQSLNDELEVVACQNAPEGRVDLQRAAGSQVSVHLGPSPEVNTENSSAGSVRVSENDVPDPSFQGDGDRSLALPEILNMGQSTGNLSQFSSEELKEEEAAIKAKETKSEVNFKERRSDSSAEPVRALPALEGKLLSLSSAGKQEGCNEEIATNICVDDKYGEILEKPGNSEEMEELSKENNNVTRAEISVSVQSAERAAREHEALTCSSLDIGSSLPDFREHISQIFKKTVHSTLSAELPQLFSENHAGFKQSPAAKGTAEPCGAEAFPESNEESKAAPEGPSGAEGQELSLATETSCQAAKGKLLQRESTVAGLPPASLQDAEKNSQPSSCAEAVPKLDGAAPAGRALENLQNPDPLISLEVTKQGPASSDGAAAENFPEYSDSKQQPTAAVISAGDGQKRDLEDAAAAEGSNLITECNAEPISSEEDVSLPTEPCQDPKPNEQEKRECGDPGTARSVSDMAASTLAPGGSYNHGKLPGNFNVAPGENQETQICSNFMRDIKSPDDMQVIQGDAETSENSPDAQQEKKVTMHGLIDYLKNEVSQDDCLQTDCKLEPSNVTEGDVKESSDTVLSTGHDKTRDTPETGTARVLVTGEGDLAADRSTEEQGTDLCPSHPPAVPPVEQGGCSARTDPGAAGKQPGEMNAGHESSFQDAKGKLSPLVSTEPENLDLNELQDVAAAGLPTD
ncbi:PREDICTED: uncharacterized protein LOC104540775, partial [Mesitornis unicolor]|uniref:uncharacterized protein LOC104540775 n=1 Tax=Mesitornis unicolor TaxID=54374 RepID=UPI0005290177